MNWNIKKRKICENPNGGPRKDITIEEILDMKKEGMSNRKIAKLKRVSEGTVRNRIKEFKANEEKIKKQRELEAMGRSLEKAIGNAIAMKKSESKSPYAKMFNLEK